VLHFPRVIRLQPDPYLSPAAREAVCHGKPAGGCGVNKNNNSPTTCRPTVEACDGQSDATSASVSARKSLRGRIIAGATARKKGGSRGDGEPGLQGVAAAAPPDAVFPNRWEKEGRWYGLCSNSGIQRLARVAVCQCIGAAAHAHSVSGDPDERRNGASVAGLLANQAGSAMTGTAASAYDRFRQSRRSAH